MFMSAFPLLPKLGNMSNKCWMVKQIVVYKAMKYYSKIWMNYLHIHAWISKFPEQGKKPKSKECTLYNSKYMTNFLNDE